jgi:phage tail-like protein
LPPSIAERTRLVGDPVRNFKFQVQLFHSNAQFSSEVGRMGFTSVDGLTMSTEMIPYREGGWNTNPHKLPGMSDFAPVTLSSGVFYQKPGLWNLSKAMFSAQWGSGTLTMNEEFRFDMIIRVLDHPVTRDAPSGVQGRPDGAVLAFAIYNAWIANCAFSGLNAMDNAVLVHNMTMHHEGLDVFWGNADALSLTHTN